MWTAHLTPRPSSFGHPESNTPPMTRSAPIQMVDLKGQYRAIQQEIDEVVLETIRSGYFIGGPRLKAFQQQLTNYTGAAHVIPCANGTDALQIALMALGLQPGDEVIVPAFTYVATAEVIGLLNLKPVMVDVDSYSFNVTTAAVEAAVTPRTKAIVPVHLFGQSVDMEPLLQLATDRKIAVVEDNAQAIGAVYTFSDGRRQQTSTLGDVGTTSFYPSKNLGAYGDGGALFTMREDYAERLRSIANHGQSTTRYYHDYIGVNSRLDAIQAAILGVKLKYLDRYVARRRQAASVYDERLAGIEGLHTPKRLANSTHVFHQYTLRVTDGRRTALQTHLQGAGIPTMVYYPVPLYRQRAYADFWDGQQLPVTEQLCEEVLSLPMHSELDEDTLAYITDQIRVFFA